MKEQIFEILHNRKRMPMERFSDIEGKIEDFVNQEVEKRIAERMPSMSENDSIYKRIFDRLNNIDPHLLAGIIDQLEREDEIENQEQQMWRDIQNKDKE